MTASVDADFDFPLISPSEDVNSVPVVSSYAGLLQSRVKCVTHLTKFFGPPNIIFSDSTDCTVHACFCPASNFQSRAGQKTNCRFERSAIERSLVDYRTERDDFFFNFFPFYFILFLLSRKCVSEQEPGEGHLTITYKKIISRGHQVNCSLLHCWGRILLWL